MTDDANADILDTLRRALHVVDAPPSHVISNARDAYLWHGIDAELAELVYDSATAAMTGVRASEATRQVTFRAPGLEIEVEVVSERARIVVGQLVPPQPATVELRQADSTTRVETDPLGRFTFDGVAPGAVKLTVRTADGARIHTEGLAI